MFWLRVLIGLRLLSFFALPLWLRVGWGAGDVSSAFNTSGLDCCAVMTLFLEVSQHDQSNGELGPSLDMYSWLWRYSQTHIKTWMSM